MEKNLFKKLIENIDNLPQNQFDLVKKMVLAKNKYFQQINSILDDKLEDDKLEIELN